MIQRPAHAREPRTGSSVDHRLWILIVGFSPRTCTRLEDRACTLSTLSRPQPLASQPRDPLCPIRTRQPPERHITLSLPRESRQNSQITGVRASPLWVVWSSQVCQLSPLAQISTDQCTHTSFPARRMPRAPLPLLCLTSTAARRMPHSLRCSPPGALAAQPVAHSA